MSESPGLKAQLTRDRWTVGGCLAIVCLLAWLWLARNAGPMSAPPGGNPGMSGMAMATRAGSGSLLGDWLTAFVMWLVMMVAMMAPSAAPMILLYAAFARGVKAQGAVLAPTFAFAAVYGVVWAGFSAIAAAVQVLLVHAGLVSEATLRLGGGRIAGALLVLAGFYQLTPLKRACLGRCRSPLSFVTRLWRPGWLGAARLGLAHGVYCVGCCGLLMALLFVGGVMSLAWVAALAVIVLIEKVAPIGERGASAVGLAAIVAGVVLSLRA